MMKDCRVGADLCVLSTDVWEQGFIHRMQLSQEIGKIKKENGLPVFDAAREEEILKKSAEAAGPEFSEPIQALYQRIFELSRSVQ